MAVLAVLAAGGLYGASEWVIRRSHAVPLIPVAVPHDATSLAEGSRLATLTGCKSCHGDGKGAIWTPVDWREGQVAPPPIARSAARYSDAELARLIRQGVTKERRTVFIMPAWSMTYLADDDVGRIVAWARSLKPAPDDVQATTWFGPVGRWKILTGATQPSVVADPHGVAKRPADPGRYLTQVLCSECHALTEPRAHDGNVVPPLAPMAASYTPADFQRLLHEGLGAGGRDVGFMGTIVKENLHALRPDEVAAVQRYLREIAAK
ncbi:cytochrome c553 [Sphingomonas trueperi]|uniref:c-type cytochrome n=1 Tax=Sphingomonas trueperi TaxID=53317 RepID=UPI003393E4AF